MHEAVFKPLPKPGGKQGVKVHLTARQIKAMGWKKSLQISWAIVKGMFMTWRHLFRRPTTFNYPNQKRSQSPRFRGIHRLQRHDDGLERCVGCSLCAVVCPPDAIYLEARENTPEHRVSHGERYASHYQIDMLRCIFCGFCEEACPEDAIVLGPNWEAASADRRDFIYTKSRLLVPLEQKDLFRRGMTWPDESPETAPVSTDLPEYYQKLQKRPA
ncbi:MAG: NADH-quinone oxidoreductase subunit NuoI [Candidatus Hinthialibacter sp.]